MRRRLRVIGVSVAAALFLLTVPRVARAQSCAASCDAACRTCCRAWRVRPTCSAGAAPATDAGEYRSFDGAANAAAALNSCAKGDAECEKRRLVCDGGASATFAPVCDPADRLLGVQETESGRTIARAAQTLLLSVKTLGEAQAQLVSFARTRPVRDKAISSVAAAADRLRMATERAAVLRAENERLSIADTAPADAAAHAQRVADASKEGTLAADASNALVADPAMVDAALEERVRRLATAARTREDAARAREEAETTRREALAAAAQDASRRASDAELRRKKAEEQHLAAQEASRQKLVEQQAEARANAASTAGQRQLLAQQKHAAILKTATVVEGQLAGALSGITATLAISNLSREQRGRAQSSEQRIKSLQERTKDVRARADAVVARPSNDSLAAVSRAELELVAIVAETKSVAVRANEAPATASTNTKEPPPVPSCVIDVVAAGTESIMVAIDGMKSVAAPTKVRLSSGRHAFVVTSGPRSARQSDLLVCGRTPSITLRSPK